MCDFIFVPDYPDFPQTFYVAIGYSVPLLLIVISYAVIIFHVRKSSKYLNSLKTKR